MRIIICENFEEKKGMVNPIEFFNNVGKSIIYYSNRYLWNEDKEEIIEI
jgi:hypothetical protein